MYGMLLAPKFMGASAIRFAGLRLKDLGGLAQFVVSFLTEVIVSIIYAPILMVQQTIAVIRTFIGVKETWVPQVRHGGRYGLWTLVKFHILETAVGALLIAGMSEGIVTWWLSPIALSLALAVPLSAASGWNLNRFKWSRGQLGTPEVFNAPQIIRSAMAERLALRKILEDGDHIAAE
jgi:membrane glycosyltransferase